MLDFFIRFISFLCWLLSILIIARSIMSWFSPRPTNIVAIYLYKVTEPLLMPLRRIVPRTGMIDFTPLLAIIILYLIPVILNNLF
jgi:YggT family protein